MIFLCPKCQKLGEVSEQTTGKTTPCPNCGQMVQVTLDLLFDQSGTSATPPESPSGEYGGPTIPRPTPQMARVPSTSPSQLLRHLSIKTLAITFASSVAFYAVLFALERLVGGWFLYSEKFLHRGWPPYVCVLLTSWSLTVLITLWYRLIRRQRSVEACSIPQSASLKTDFGAEQVIGYVDEITRKHGDDKLGARVRKLIAHLRISRSADAVMEVLNAERDADSDELNAELTTIRGFLWAIPTLGFIGTVIGIGTSVSGFGNFLSVGAQELDDIKAALIKVTADLAVAFDTTLVALLLSVVVMICLSYVESSHERVSYAIDEFCRQRIIPLMFAARSQASGSSDEAAGRLAEILRAIIDLRVVLTNLVPTAGTSASGDSERASGDGHPPWAAELERRGGEISQVIKEYSDIRKQNVEKDQAANLELVQHLTEIHQLIADAVSHNGLRTAARETPAPGSQSRGEPVNSGSGTGYRSLGDENETGTASLDGSGVGTLSNILTDLKGGLGEMENFLHELAGRLKVLANDPNDLKFKIVVRSRELGQ